MGGGMDAGAAALHAEAHQAGGGEGAAQQDRACHQVRHERLAEDPVPADHRQGICPHHHTVCHALRYL